MLGSGRRGVTRVYRIFAIENFGLCIPHLCFFAALYPGDLTNGYHVTHFKGTRYPYILMLIVVHVSLAPNGKDDPIQFKNME